MKKEIEAYLKEGINFSNILNNAYFDVDKKGQIITQLQNDGILNFGITEMADIKLNNPNIKLLNSKKDVSFSSGTNYFYEYNSDFVYTGKMWYEYKVWFGDKNQNYFLKDIEISGYISLVKRSVGCPSRFEIKNEKVKFIWQPK